MLNHELRNRDIRKLVVPHLHEVTWDSGTDETSEWVVASCEDSVHLQKLFSWLKSKNISDSCNTIFTDTAWTELQRMSWGTLLEKLEHYFNLKHVLVVAADRTWVIEYAPEQVIRFGRWVNVT